MKTDETTERVATTATVLAFVIIAHQIAGKATRDAAFLSHFEIGLLPAMIIGAAVFSILFTLGAARLMTRYGPGRLLPATFVASAMLFVIEWSLLSAAPGPVAILLYLHLAAGGALLISGFWSLVNELLDPNTAKLKMGRIAGGATLGGLVGGLTAERMTAWLGSDPMFPLLAGMHLFCAWRVFALRQHDRKTESTTPSEDDEASPGGFKVLANSSHLRNLTILLVLTTLAAGLVDFVFKAQAGEAFAGDRDGLLRFFALFYAVTGFAAFLAQSLLAKLSLEKVGLARTAAALPAVVIAAGGLAIALPGIITATLLRGGEEIGRNSLFRSAYELLFTPVARKDKRATKLIIDLGFVRLADAMAAGVVSALMLAGAAVAYPTLVGIAVAVSIVALLLTARLHRGYVAALTHSLETQAEALDLDEIRDSATRRSVMETFGSLDISAALGKLKAATPSFKTRIAAPLDAVKDEPIVATVRALASRDLERVTAALRNGPLTPTAVPLAIDLLAWDAAKSPVSRALEVVAPAITGQLVDALLDPDRDFAIRRRIPRILRVGSVDLARYGLMRGLQDRRFEVRYHSGAALVGLSRRHELTFNRDAVFALVGVELAVSEHIWSSHRLLEQSDTNDNDNADDLQLDVANIGLKHVFTLLGLVLPRKPVRIAFRGLHTDDPVLRGTALEYIESVLPEDIAKDIRRVADAHDVQETSAHSKGAADRLLESAVSIENNLARLHDQKAIQDAQ